METRHYWEENGHAVKYDNYNSNDGFRRAGDSAQLNFAAASEDEAEYPGAYIKKGKVTRQDPMSHRIIEKRRRDRMNNCLADLSRLIPPEYLKKGRGRVEKTEIIEMAIRHLKYLQDRANVAERQMGEDFRAGFQEAVAEAVRFLVEVQGYSHGDGICVQLAAHLQRHCDNVTKGHPRDTKPRHASRSHPGSSSETTSSSSSCQGYAVKPMITTTAPSGPPPFPAGAYEPERPSDLPYMMECDRGTEGDSLPESEPLPLDGRRQREQNLRAVRKDHTEDYLHSYKFKNSIERRFSKSQDTEAAQAMAPHGAGAAGGGKAHAHKRRRAHKPAPSTSASGSTEETRDNSPQDTSSESPHQHYDKLSSQYVPVFALNSLGKYYVPLSVSYACLSRHLGSFDVLDASAAHLAAPLHPVTIHVNFQPCLNYHVKQEPPEWRPN